MAIHAVHGPQLRGSPCPPCLQAFIGEDLDRAAVEVRVAHPRDLLPAGIGGLILYAHARIYVPVDPFYQSQRLLGRSCLQVQPDAPRRVGLIGEIMGAQLQLVPVEFMRPVALLADRPRRTEGVGMGRG